MSFLMQDNLPLGQVRRTRDGYLVAEVLAARIGIQDYKGSEVGRPDLDRVRVYRPESEVFHENAMDTFPYLPITVNHPSEKISSKNWKKYSVGFTGDKVARDGGYIRVPLILKDENAINQVSQGKRELSFGYMCDVEFTPGKTPEGEEYDAVQRNLRGNHLAIVSAGRAGRECRLGDEEDLEMPEIKKFMVDGIPVPVTDEAETVIKTLQGRIASLTADNIKMTGDHAAALSIKDKELGEKDGEIVKLRAQVPDAVAIDKMVSDRAETTARARVISDGDYTGKSVPEIRRLAVAKKLGDGAVNNRNDDYVEALFDSLSSQLPQGNGHLSRDMASFADSRHVTDATVLKEAARTKMIQDMETGWQRPVFQTTK